MTKQTQKDFENWLHGEGEDQYGHILKRAAGIEKQRLKRALGDGGLFPHIDHETQQRIAHCDYVATEGQKKIDRHRRRSERIKSLLADGEEERKEG